VSCWRPFCSDVPAAANVPAIVDFSANAGFPTFTGAHAEMEFLNGILIEVSGHKLESSQTRVFIWFSFSCFADFL
jgi:hypothetical protein